MTYEIKRFIYFRLYGVGRYDRDSFRGSGQMLWWMAGASAFMMPFSAWIFPGAASDVYSNGLRIRSVFWGSALGFAIAGIYLCQNQIYKRKKQLETTKQVDA